MHTTHPPHVSLFSYRNPPTGWGTCKSCFNRHRSFYSYFLCLEFNCFYLFCHLRLDIFTQLQWFVIDPQSQIGGVHSCSICVSSVSFVDALFGVELIHNAILTRHGLRMNGVTWILLKIWFFQNYFVTSVDTRTSHGALIILSMTLQRGYSTRECVDPRGVEL